MKVGIVAQEDFLVARFNERDYVLGLGLLLSKTMRVDYVARQRLDSAAHWYQLQPLPKRFFGEATPTPPRLAIGTDLGIERYDALIVSSPECITFTERLPAGRIIGLAFEASPGNSSFTNWDDRPFASAAEQVCGYRYYREHADVICALGPDTAAALTALFSIPASKIVTLPTFPVAAEDSTEENEGAKAGFEMIRDALLSTLKT